MYLYKLEEIGQCLSELTLDPDRRTASYVTCSPPEAAAPERAMRAFAPLRGAFEVRRTEIYFSAFLAC